jgi:Bacterial SH3 domain
MKRNQVLLTILATAAITLGTAVSAFAYGGGTLTSNNPRSRINVRSQPSTRAYSPHYGVSGDRVKVLRSTRGRDGYDWYFVRFPRSGAEGWVRGDLISLND